LGGPASTIQLTDENDIDRRAGGKYVIVTVWVDSRELANTTYVWRVPQGGYGTGALCGEGNCASIVSGRLEFGDVDSHGASGERLLQFTNGVQVHKRFRARWRDALGLCE